MAKIGSEYKYQLTRMCLQNGLLSLPASMMGLFPEKGEVIARDAETSDTYNLDIIDSRRIAGLRDFMQDNLLTVNDFVVIQLDDDGNYALRAEKRPRQVTGSFESFNINKVLDQLFYSGVDHSEAEIHQAYDVPISINIASILSADKRFILKSGRWGVLKEQTPKQEAKIINDDYNANLHQEAQINRSQVGQSKELKSPKSYQGGVSEHQEKLKELFRDLGYHLNVLSPEIVTIRIDLGRRQYSALLYLLNQGSNLDWTSLLNQRREIGLDYIAIFADKRDLFRLTAPATSARISLWSWQGFERLIDYNRSISISPFDLENHFIRDGLFEKGLENFETRMQKIIMSRGRFSAVLEHLASMGTSAVFFLDDIQVEGYDRNDVLKVLDLLEHSPFQIVQKIADGEFYLRQSVDTALEHFSDYALSLKSRLPRSAKNSSFKASAF